MHDKDSLWNSILYELKCRGEIECYAKLNELHSIYSIIIYNHAKIQTKAKEDCINY